MPNWVIDAVLFFDVATKYRFASIAALALLANPAMALNQEEIDAACGKVAQLAEVTMRARQNGTPLQELLEAERTKLSPTMAALGRILASKAYSWPRLAKPNSQEIGVTRFREEWRLECLKAQPLPQ